MEEEGEADFVVIHDNFIAVVEVKAVQFEGNNHKTVFERNYRKSKQQNAKTCELIRGICRNLGSSKELDLRQFTVFTNIDREAASKISKYKQLNETEKQTLLFKDDLGNNKTNFCKCFENKGLDETSILKEMCDILQNDLNVAAEVLWTLIGLWCADDKNQFKRDKWEIGGKINNIIDQLLENASISNKPEGPLSSKVKGSPKIFKRLGIKCLTEEQKKIINEKKPRFMINGPAGSGKTILVLGKVIQLVEKCETPIIILVSTRHMAKECEKKLGTAAVDSLICTGPGFANEKCLEKYQVVIIYFDDYSYTSSGMQHFNYERCETLFSVFQTNAHIFIDDFHAYSIAIKETMNSNHIDYLVKDDKVEDFLDYIPFQLSSSSSKLLWVCYDSLQATTDIFHDQYGTVKNWETKGVTIHKLTASLRNSHEISNFLKVLRDTRLEIVQYRIEQYNSLSNQNFMKEYCKRRKTPDAVFYDYHPFDVKQDTGHYIHGPMPKILWEDVHGRDKDSIADYLTTVLKNEVYKLSGCDNIALIHDDYGSSIRNIEESESEYLDDIRKRLQDQCERDPIRTDEMCQRTKEELATDFPGMNLKILHLDEIDSAEWPVVIGIIKLNKHEEKLSSMLKDSDNFKREFFEMLSEYHGDHVNSEVVFKQDKMDRFLGKLYAIASRGRAHIVIICVTDLGEPFDPSKYETSEEGCIDVMFLKDLGFDFIDLEIFGESNPKLCDCEPLNLIKEEIIMILETCFLLPDSIWKSVQFPSGKIIPGEDFARNLAGSVGIDLSCRNVVSTSFEDDRKRAKLIRNTNQIKIRISFFTEQINSVVLQETSSYLNSAYPSKDHLRESRMIMMKITTEYGIRNTEKTYYEGHRGGTMKTDEDLFDEDLFDKVERLLSTSYVFDKDYELMSPEEKFASWRRLIKLPRGLATLFPELLEIVRAIKYGI